MTSADKLREAQQTIPVERYQVWEDLDPRVERLVEVDIVDATHAYVRNPEGRRSRVRLDRLRRHFRLTTMSAKPIPPEDLKRAEQYVRERGWVAEQEPTP